MTAVEPTPLTNAEEVLRRQVHPHQLDDDRVLRTAFIPVESHGGMLSTLRERVGAEEAYQRHLAADLESVGTWGVAVGEAEGAGAPAIDDECLPESPPDHASLDFTEHPTRNQVKRVARHLANHANERGPLYRPND